MMRRRTSSSRTPSASGTVPEWRGFHAVGGGLDQPGAGDRFSVCGWKSLVGGFTDAFAGNRGLAIPALKERIVLIVAREGGGPKASGLDCLPCPLSIGNVRRSCHQKVRDQRRGGDVRKGEAIGHGGEAVRHPSEASLTGGDGNRVREALTQENHPEWHPGFTSQRWRLPDLCARAARIDVEIYRDVLRDRVTTVRFQPG
jgi:hypothetical protein